MKKLAISVIYFLTLSSTVFAQNSAPKETPQYNNPMEAMQQMMEQFQKMFGSSEGNFPKSDSTQTFGFQQFKLPFGDTDSTMNKAFGFTFDGNGFKSMTPENGDSTNANGFQQMQEQFKKMMPNMDFEKLFEGQTPFGSDPSVVQPMDKKRREDALKSKKKYQTEKL